jgi:hypothetical protein
MLSDADFIALFEKHGPHKTSEKIGVGVRSVYKRRVTLEKKLNRQITGPDNPARTRQNVEHPHRIELDIQDGVVLIGSDAHYWPGEASTAHRALVKFCNDLTPAAVIMNGDAFDGASISRFPPIGWESAPTVAEEVGAVQRRLRELTNATPDAAHIWTLGNHDGRFETRLATVAPEFAAVEGVHLRDHFPDWTPSWSVWINDEVVVKHRFKGGIHATHNNAMWSGKTMVTGHLHSLKCTPFTDYNGTRWGIDTGTLADPDGKQFTDYSEDAPKNHRSGFIVLTFKDGELMDPEMVRVWDETQVCFRGGLVGV